MHRPPERRSWRGPLALAAAAAALVACGDVSPGAPGGTSTGAGGGSVPDPCPPGQTPAPGGGCMPVGPQGCAGVFLGEDGLCMPSASKCPAGQIPSFATGCTPVGIDGCAAELMEPDGLCHPSLSKCPAGTIPKFDQGCVPVGIADCHPDFLGADGVCRPSESKCPTGTFPVPSRGCVSVDGAGCGAGTWGDIPDGPKNVYVDMAYLGGDGDGSKAKPFPTLTEALGVAGDGSRVAVAAGTYAEPVGVTAGIELIGRCPSMVTLAGAHGTLLGVPAVVSVVGAIGASIAGVRVSGAGIGILAYESVLDVHGVHIGGAMIAGILIAGPSSVVTMTESLVEGTTSDPANGVGGRGIDVEAGAVTSISGTAVLRNRGEGMFATAPGTSITATDCVVEGTFTADHNGERGVGLHAQTGAHLAMTGSAVLKNHHAGVVALNQGTELTLGESVVADTLPKNNNHIGWGLAVDDGAKVKLTTTAVVNNHEVGIHASSPGTSLDASGCLIRGTLPGVADDFFGHGVHVEGGAELSLTDSAVVESRYIGVVAVDQGTRLTVSRSLIEGTESLASDDTYGWGAYVQAGAQMVFSRSAAVSNRDVGVAAFDPGTVLTVERSLIDRTRPRASDGWYGRGLAASHGAQVDVSSSAIVDNHDMGMFAEHAGTALAATGNLVRGTLPRESDQGDGRGIAVQEGAHATLTRNLFLDNHMVGMSMDGVGTEATLTENLVEGTRPQQVDSAFGLGGQIATGAKVSSNGDAFIANRDVGLLIDTSASVHASGLVVAGTLPQESDGTLGVGVFCADLAELFLSSSLLRKNLVSGVLVGLATTEIDSSLVDGVPSGTFFLAGTMEKHEGVGDGIIATAASTVRVTRTRLTGCERAGILFDASGGAIERSQADGNGFGLVLQGSPRPDVDTESSFEGNLEGDRVESGDLPLPDAPSAVPPSQAE